MALNRDRVRRLEASGFYGGTLELPDGTRVSFGRGELMAALVAEVKGEPHRLLPYLREAEGDLPDTIRALGGVQEEGGAGE